MIYTRLIVKIIAFSWFYYEGPGMKYCLNCDKWKLSYPVVHYEEASAWAGSICN